MSYEKGAESREVTLLLEGAISGVQERPDQFVSFCPDNVSVKLRAVLARPWLLPGARLVRTLVWPKAAPMSPLLYCQGRARADRQLQPIVMCQRRYKLSPTSSCQ